MAGRWEEGSEEGAEAMAAAVMAEETVETVGSRAVVARAGEEMRRFGAGPSLPWPPSSPPPVIATLPPLASPPAIAASPHRASPPSSAPSPSSPPPSPAATGR